MFGMEKKKDGEKSMFDLEQDIKSNPARGKELLDKAESRQQEIKKTLRDGADEKDFDHLGVLLHGYTALQKVLKKAMK
jgi:hypothetical protein